MIMNQEQAASFPRVLQCLRSDGQILDEANGNIVASYNENITNIKICLMQYR